ncbi:MAG TPA: Crp/Fnr family transcriptional regulator [Xanthobacteraceae bacterium]|nr:Crp/Fnr family transcriptional regulator [Xanthobacteraceae bacterium]
MPLEDHPLVTKLSTFMTLSPGDLKSLGNIFEGERSIKKQKDLIVDGVEYKNLCFVRDGYAMRYKLLRNGKRQILSVILPGDVIGFPVSFFERSTYSVVALSDLKINICSLDAYVRLCFERPQFGLVLSWLAMKEAAIYAERIVDIGRRTPVERLVHFLLELHSRLLTIGLAEKTSFNLPISQEVMADALGLSVPHLNRVMQHLRKEKLISNRARLVEFSDISSLQTLAHYQPLVFARIPVPGNN